MMKYILPLILTFQVAAGFVTPQTATTTRQSASALQLSEFSEALSSTSHALSALFPEATANKDLAKTQFFFFFFAGSGAGGLGIAQIPKILAELKMIRDLSEEGPTEGGDSLQTGPLVSLLYPKKLSEKDVRKVLAKVPTSAKIVANGKSESYFASKGYVIRDDFLLSLKGCNPLASYALFQAIAQGRGNCVGPDEVDDKLQGYKQDKEELKAFVADFNESVQTKLSSYAALAFLLFITIDIIVETGFAAFT